MIPVSIISSFIFAFLTTAILTPIFIPIIKFFGLVDDPRKHKHPALLHKKPIPRAGGIPLLLGIIVPGLFILPKSPLTISLLISSVLALIIGTLDDKFDISRYFRLIMNIVCAAIVVGAGVGIPFVTNPFGGILHLDIIKWNLEVGTFHFAIPIISSLLAILWIVWTMNMLNWSKGVDGQMPGVVAIAAVVIGLLSLRFPISETNTYLASHLSFLIAGSAIGFLLYNFHPAKIFPGYGATSIYLLLAVVSLLSGAKLATAILVMGVPMVDGLFTVIRRILSGKSPFWHDKKHLHHLLLQLGYGQRSIALFYWVISAILGTASLTLSSKGKLFALIMLLVIVGGGILFLHTVTKAQREEKNN